MEIVLYMIAAAGLFAGLIAGLFVGLFFLRLGIVGLSMDSTEIGKNKARIDSFSDIILGRVRPKDDWIPDSRVQCGMVYNHKERRLEVSGRLSVESLKRGIRSSH